VLAAGYSKRFQRSAGIPKQLATLRGYPLICYPLTSLGLAGFEAVVAASPELSGRLRQVVAGCRYTAGVEFVEVSEPWRGNGYTFSAAAL
jgi:choline kinase